MADSPYSKGAMMDAQRVAEVKAWWSKKMEPLELLLKEEHKNRDEIKAWWHEHVSETDENFTKLCELIGSD